MDGGSIKYYSVYIEKKQCNIYSSMMWDSKLIPFYMFITNNVFLTLFITQGKPGVFIVVVTHMGNQNKQKKKVVILYLFDN